MNDVDRLVAIEEIKQLKARYFRGVDLQDWRLLGEEVFTDDISADYRNCATDPRSGVNFAPAATGDVITGKNPLLDALKDSLDGVVSSHQGFTPEITIASPTEAKGIWAMYDCLAFPPDHELAEFFGYGHYYETYVKTESGWRIKKLQHVRTRVGVNKR